MNKYMIVMLLLKIKIGTGINAKAITRIQIMLDNI